MGGVVFSSAALCYSILVYIYALCYSSKLMYISTKYGFWPRSASTTDNGCRCAFFFSFPGSCSANWLRCVCVCVCAGGWVGEWVGGRRRRSSILIGTIDRMDQLRMCDRHINHTYIWCSIYSCRQELVSTHPKFWLFTSVSRVWQLEVSFSFWSQRKFPS